MEVEQTIPDYREAYGAWLEEDPARAAVSFQRYAYDTLTQLDPTPYESKNMLKRHVYALGKVAGLSTDQRRDYTENYGGLR